VQSASISIRTLGDSWDAAINSVMNALKSGSSRQLAVRVVVRISLSMSGSLPMRRMFKKKEKSFRSKKRCLNSVNLTGMFVMNVEMEMTKTCFWYVTVVNFIAVMFTVMSVCIMFFPKKTGTV
jgi:hypothetical protein